MKKVLAVLIALSAAGIVSTAQAAPDIAAGKAKAGVCAGCHGPNGISSNPVWPNLAGQKEQYLAKQLHDFRSGARTNPLMSPMAKPLSDQDIENLAAYFHSLSCK